jgi:hypothetical protein
MRLSYYPDAIARALEGVNEFDQKLARLRQEMAYLEGEAELIVAFDTTLKNEDQRKARRFQILSSNPAYHTLQTQWADLTTERSSAVAQLERLRDQFNVAKLEARLAIVEKLSMIESRELVGL